MKKSDSKPYLFIAVLALLAAIMFLVWSFFSGSLSLGGAKQITRYDAITFNVVPGWKVYHKNQNYDIDIGYFQKGKLPTCTINAITTNLNRTPSLEQFMATTLGGKLFTDSHKEIKFKDLDAWRGTYIFPSKGIVDPAYNDRLLLRYKTLYVDITLSYNTALDEATKDKCKNDYQTFLDNIQLL